MNIIIQNKYCFIFLFLLLIAPPYFYSVLWYEHAQLTPLYWITCFFFLLFLFYLIFVISTLVQLVAITLFSIVPIKLFSLYPITYDGKFRVHPIRLLYTPEGFTNSMLLNLSPYLESDQFHKKLCALHWIRLGGYVVAYLLLFLMLQQYTISMLVLCISSCLITIVLGYFHIDGFWHGYDTLITKDETAIKLFLCQAKSIGFLTADTYATLLREEEIDVPFTRLCILENYLYRCIIEHNTILSEQELRTVLQAHDVSDAFTYNLTIDTKALHIKKLIGWVGICVHESTYIECSIDLLSIYYDQMVTEGFPLFVKHGTSTLKEELHYLKHYEELPHCELRLLTFQNIFSFYEDLTKQLESIS